MVRSGVQTEARLSGPPKVPEDLASRNDGCAVVLFGAVCHDNLKIHARVLASLGIEGHWPAKLAT